MGCANRWRLWLVCTTFTFILIFALLAGQVLQPDALFDQDESDGAFDQIQRMVDQEDQHHRQAGKANHDGDRRNGADPQEHTVKEEGDDGFSAGTQGEVGRVDKSQQRRGQSLNLDEPHGDMLDFRGSIIELRKQRSDEDEKNSCNHAAEHGKGDELIVFLPGFFQFSRPKQLPHDDANRAAQRSEDYVGNITQGIGDVFCGYDVKPQHGIALRQESQRQ